MAQPSSRQMRISMPPKSLQEWLYIFKVTDGMVDGAFEIVSVDSATQLTVSVLRADGQE